MKRPITYAINALVILLALLYLSPVYIVLVNSFKNRSELYENLLALPGSLSFQYYANALSRMQFLRSLGNSLLVTVFSIGILIVLASMTAWMLVRANNRPWLIPWGR